MLQNKGIVVYELSNTDKKFIDIDTNSSGYNRLDFINFEKIEEATEKIKEVRSMEGLNDVLTVVGSAIAGVYCAIKTIIAFFKKFKK